MSVSLVIAQDKPEGPKTPKTPKMPTESVEKLVEKAGGSGFRDHSLPEAILKFKQGFGRLVRTANDRGRVVVLDPRIRTKGYGRDFLRALPEGLFRRDG